MKKTVSIPMIVAVVVAALGLVGFLFLRDGSGVPTTSADKQIIEGLEKAKGDINKLDPETRRLYDEGIKAGRYQSPGTGPGGPPPGVRTPPNARPGAYPTPSTGGSSR